MRLIAFIITLFASLTLAACSDSDGGATDGGSDGGTDTDTDADTDADGGADGGTDAGEECSPDVTCPIRVVGDGGDDANFGNSWELGLATVERALDLAAPCGCDVWVKAGTHFPTHDAEGSSTPEDPRTVTFLLRSGVALYGGFAGTETELAQRDVVANVTTLRGGLEVFFDITDNVYHVVTGTEGATIDGFTIREGKADGSGDAASGFGGGMYNRAASPVVRNCTFWENTATSGGAMYNEDSSPTITDCTFTENSASDADYSGSGGGMYNDDSSPTITDCTFSENAAFYGGGMFNESSSPTITGCTFSENTASDDDGYPPGNGGGMFNESSSPTITDCTFSGNSAGFGSSCGGGGGMCNVSSSPLVTNCIFSGNYVIGVTWGGMSTAWAYGGGMCNISSSPTVTDCIFTGNGGSLVFGCAIANTDSSLPTVTNCILWGNIDEADFEEIKELFDEGSATTLTYSDIQGGHAGEGNIDADPMFVDAGAGDFRLQPGSPCIDTGSNDAVPDDVTTDLDGNPRIVDGDGDDVATVDMGAYEYQP